MKGMITLGDITAEYDKLVRRKLAAAVADGPDWWWFPCLLLALAVLSAAVEAVVDRLL